MKIVFCGSPDFACIPMEALLKAGHEISLVVSTPDKPKDRGKKVQPTPVAEKAEALGLSVIKPVSLKKDPSAVEAIRAENPDFVVVFAYGRMLPIGVLTAAKYGCINIHASLLPRYRGAAPIQRAIMAGEERIGITIMQMEEGLDTGGMYASASTEADGKTAAQLSFELATLGAELLVKSLPEIAAGKLLPEKQDDSLSNYAEMIFKAEGEIDWTKTPREIDCLVRAFNDFPIAWTKLGDTVLKIYEVQTTANAADAQSGSVLSAGKQGIEVACSGGSILIKVLQAPGKKAMSADAFLLGNKIEIGTVLG